MKDFQIRVLEEKRELDERLTKLQAFVDSPAFHLLDARNQGLLHWQGITMRNYSMILSDRIELFQ